MKSTMRTLILFAIGILSVGVAVSAGMLGKIATIVVKSEPGDTFIYIEGVGSPANVAVDITDADGDGYGDYGHVKVENRADFTLDARVVNLQVAVFYESGEKTDFLEDRTGHGIWEFYEDSDSNGQISSGDIKIGKLKIKQGSSSLDEDAFKVASESSKDLEISMEYRPYAPGKSAGADNYTVSFDIYVIGEEYVA